MLSRLLKSKYLVIFIMGFIVITLIIGLNGTHEISEYVRENYGIAIDMDSNGNENIYVKDGVIVSFQNVYHNDNYIALKVKAVNNSDEPIQVSALIEDLEQNISFTVLKEEYEYIIIGDSQATAYEVDVLIEQRGLPLASGVIHVTHNKENASVLTSHDIISFSEKLKVHYLGQDEDTQFFTIVNNYKTPKNILFSNGASGFHINVDVGTNEYVYVKGLGATNISMQTFDITVRDVIEEEVISSEEAALPN